MKNDNFHTFFSLSWLQMFNLPALLQNKNTRIGPFPWKRSVLQNPDRERTNQSTGICRGLGLPYNKYAYLRVRVYLIHCVMRRYAGVILFFALAVVNESALLWLVYSGKNFNFYIVFYKYQ